MAYAPVAGVAFAIGTFVLTLAACSNDPSNHQVDLRSRPSDDSGTEPASADAALQITSTASRILAPIRHESNFRHERDVYGYTPGFEPNPASFDRQNRPYILGIDATVRKLKDDGTWQTIDLVPQVEASLARQGITWNKVFRLTRERQNMIVFDNKGDAYTLLDTSTSVMTRAGTAPEDAVRLPVGVLLHSRDGGVTWDAYPVKDFTAAKGARLEFRDSFNNMYYPPAITLHGSQQYLVDPRTNLPKDPAKEPKPGGLDGYLIVPTRKTDGTLDISERVTFTNIGMFGDLHSGAGNTMLSVDNLIHVAFIEFNKEPATIVDNEPRSALPCARGTPTYLVTYDRSTKVLGPRRALGCAGAYDKAGDPPAPDSHNTPALTVDSLKYLHVVLGAHHDNFLYRKSLRPNDASAWSPGVLVGEAKRDATLAPTSRDANVGSYTYVGLICDRNDNLHIVARWAGIKYSFQVVHLRKSAHTATDAWDTFSDDYSKTFLPTLSATLFPSTARYKHQHLVVPGIPGYVVYHHKLTIDRFGRLYLSYETHEKEFSPAIVGQYCAKWPSECTRDANNQLTLVPDARYADSCATSVCLYGYSTKGHDPAMLRSNDGGTTWQLVTTADLLTTISN